MRIFFKFFLLGLRELFIVIMGVIILLMPWVIGISLARSLNNMVSGGVAVTIAIVLVVLGYAIIYISVRSFYATKYYKEHNNVESLKEAWDRTHI